jgi:hypothetical protein
MTSPDAAPEPTASAAAPVAPAAAARGASAREPVLPVLPVQSSEDTDAAWGEYPDRADDHLTRDRPPHWDDY